MARSHGRNPNFDAHCEAMRRGVENFRFAFDDSFESVPLYGTPLVVPANTLHIDPKPHQGLAECYGEFQLVGSPPIRVSVKKRIALFKTGQRLESLTESYAYQVYMVDGRLNRTRLIRFDNQHDGDYGYPTSHHAHIAFDPVPQGSSEGQPAHVGPGYPHIGDVLSIAHALLIAPGGAVQHFDELRHRFRRIPAPERAEPRLWVERLAEPSFSFLLPE